MTGRGAIISICLLLSATCLSAQPGTNDRSRYGHGKDSLECLLNIGLSYDLVQKGKYKQAYKPWRKAITAHPRAQTSLYSNGAHILHALLLTEKDSLQKASYLNELCDLYDLNILYLDDLNKLQLRPTQRDVLYLLKAHDYLTYGGGCLHPGKAYTYIQEAVDCARSPLPSQWLHLWQQIQAYTRTAGRSLPGEQQKIWDNMSAQINELCKQTSKE